MGKGKTIEPVRGKTRAAKIQRTAKTDSAAGTYVYDKRLGRIVKVSDHVPGISAHGKPDAGESSDVGPCGRTECGGGVCAGGDFN